MHFQTLLELCPRQRIITFHAIDRLSWLLVPGIEDFWASTWSLCHSLVAAKFSAAPSCMRDWTPGTCWRTRCGMTCSGSACGKQIRFSKGASWTVSICFHISHAHLGLGLKYSRICHSGAFSEAGPRCVLVNASSQFHAIDRPSWLLVPGIEDFWASTWSLCHSLVAAKFSAAPSCMRDWTPGTCWRTRFDDLLRIGMRKTDSIFEGCIMDSLYMFSHFTTTPGLRSKIQSHLPFGRIFRSWSKVCPRQCITITVPSSKRSIGYCSTAMSLH